MSAKYSSTVSFLCQQCDGWIVGSAADPANVNPRDIDIIIPFSKWHIALGALPKDKSTIKINTYGGFKFIDELGVEVDVWTGELNTILTYHGVKYLYSPWHNIRFKKDLS